MFQALVALTVRHSLLDRILSLVHHDMCNHVLYNVTSSSFYPVGGSRYHPGASNSGLGMGSSGVGGGADPLTGV